MTFFEKLLPADGLKCVAMALPKGGFRHFFYEDLDAALAQVELLDRQGHTVYLAQASFDAAKIAEAQAHNAALPKDLSKDEWKKRRKKERAQENAQWLRAFFLDIDCGEEKFAASPNTAYPTQKDAVADLKRLVEETGLPFPAVVMSGNGLYAYWFIDTMLASSSWQTIAHILKKTLVAYKFKADPSRTSDSASVLRPPGTTNRKPGKDPKPVRLLRDAEPLPFMAFVRILREAAKKKHVDTTPTKPPQPVNDINADFYSGLEGPRPEVHLLTKKCRQVADYEVTAGNVAEPLWYAMIGLLSFCEASDAEADERIHLWSEGHPDYSHAATEAKIAQFRATGTGPTTCAHLGSINPNACIGCRHSGKIKSPIVLGRPEPEAVEQAPEEAPVPKNFRRTAEGLFAEKDGEWVCFYDCDLRPVRLSFDSTLGYETATIRHRLPHEGEMEFSFRSSLLTDPKGFLTVLADNHVKVVGTREKNLMVAYMEGYLQSLQRHRRMTQLLSQMGWKEDREGKPFFVLGQKILHADGTVEEAALARGVPTAAQGFRQKGSLQTWVEATEVLAQPHMEPFAFALLCGFAAPLMKFTGFDGAAVSMVGESGIGKTLMLRFAQSIYGFHNDLMMLRDDTRNALVSRLGVYGTLPLAVDEVTNIDGQELSDLVYRITQGRDKARLNKNAEERKVLNSWNTLALLSTNSSLIDKLGSLKHDASAEINRVFEYPVAAHPHFCKETTTRLYWTLHEHYGIAGEEYVKYLVKNFSKIKVSLDKVREKIDGDAKIRGEERFWSAVAAAAIYGGVVAKHLGLIRFEVAPVLAWVTRTIRNMRQDKDELAGNAVDILGQFLDEHAGNRLLVKGDCTFGKPAIPIDTPRGALIIRHEVDNHKLFLSRQTFKTWLAKRFGSYRKVMTELMDLGALKDANQKKVLGAGTQYGGAQQPCWVIDLKCHRLGSVGLTLVQEAEMLKRGVEK